MSGLNENRPITQQTVTINYNNIGSSGSPLYSVLAEDGFIYSVVESGTMAQLRQLDADTLEDNLYCNLGIYTGGCGIIQAANSKLYVIPERTTQIMEIDLVNKTVFHFGAFPTGKTRMYYCAHLAPNGNFYMIPYTSAQVVEVNPFTKTCTFIGEPVSGYIGCTMGKDGIIYSFKHDKVLKVNPNDSTVTEEPLSRLVDYTYHNTVEAYSCCVTTTGEIVILWANFNNETETGTYTLSHYNTTSGSNTIGINISRITISDYSYRWSSTNPSNVSTPNNIRFTYSAATSLKLLNNNNILITGNGVSGNSVDNYPTVTFNVYDISTRTLIYRNKAQGATRNYYNQHISNAYSYLLNNNTVLTLIQGQNRSAEPRAFKLDTGFAKVIPKTAYMSPYINKMR